MTKVLSKAGRALCLFFKVAWFALVPLSVDAKPINNRHGVSLAILERVKNEADGQSYDIQQEYTLKFRRRLARSGINLVRLVIRPSPMLVGSAASRVRATAQVTEVVNQLVEQKLTVIVDPHFWPPDTNDDNIAVSCGASSHSYSEMLLRLAQALNDVRHDRVMLELLNEPNPCKVGGKPGWLSTQGSFVREIRRTFRTLPLLVTGTQGGPGPLWIDPAQYVDDKNIYFSWHYYEPFIFTHQDTYYGFKGVPWPGPGDVELGKFAYTKIDKSAAKPSDLGALRHYLSSYGGASTVAKEFSLARNWAQRNRIAPHRIIVGEFGINWKPVSEVNRRLRDDELHWIRTVQSQAKMNKFSSAFWILPLGGDNFNFDKTEGFLRSDVLNALGFSVPAKPQMNKKLQ